MRQTAINPRFDTPPDAADGTLPTLDLERFAPDVLAMDAELAAVVEAITSEA